MAQFLEIQIWKGKAKSSYERCERTGDYGLSISLAIEPTKWPLICVEENTIVQFDTMEKSRVTRNILDSKLD